MTVGTTAYFTDWQNANGVNKNWTYTFPILDDDSVVILVRDVSTPNTITEYRSDFTRVAVDTNNGTIIFPVTAAALGATKQVRIVREVPYTQLTQIGSEGAFNPEIHEKAFDKLTMICQQLFGAAERSLRFPLGDTVTELPTVRAGKVLAFDEDGNPIAGPTPGEIANAASYAAAAMGYRDQAEGYKNTAAAQAIIATNKAGEAAASAAEAALFGGLAWTPYRWLAVGGETVLAFGSAINPARVDVVKNGSTLQSNGADYALSATEITLTEALVAGDVVEAKVYASFAVADALRPSQNLADLSSVVTARANLGLGSAAVLGAGVGANEALKLDAGGRVPASAVTSGSLLGTAYVEYATLLAVTAVIPYDATPPLITEGTEIMTLVYTPKRAGSKIIVSVTANGTPAVPTPGAVALFAGATLLGVGRLSQGSSYFYDAVSFTGVVSPADLTPITFSTRAGPGAAGTLYVNGAYNGLAAWAGGPRCSMIIQEIAP